MEQFRFGQLPIFEPGLDEIINVVEGKIPLFLRKKVKTSKADMVFISVNTLLSEKHWGTS